MTKKVEHFYFLALIWVKMEKTFLEKQKVELLEQQKTLEDKLLLVAKKGKSGDFKTSFPDYGRSEDDSVFEFEDFDKNLSLEKNLVRTLKDVKKALLRIDKNRYGICSSCKKEIPEGRLEVYPSADLCVDCKSKKPSLLSRVWPFGRR